MILSKSQQDQKNISNIPAYLKLQRLFFATCIILGPLAFLLYTIFGPDGSGGSAIIAANRVENVTLNQLHLLFGILASFSLPFGFLAMARLAMRHTPWLGTIAGLLALPSWIPLSALIGLDALTYDMAQMGGGTQFAMLWDRFNSDGVMFPYLLIYAACHLICTVLLGIALGRARIIPIWAACALIISSPLTIIAFPLPNHHLFLIAVLLLMVVGSAPASLAMLKSLSKDEAQSKNEISTLLI